MAIAVAEVGLLAPCWRWFLSALLICPVVVVCQGQPIAAEKEAASLVQKFAQFDFEGYRLDSERHQAIWKLTIDDGAPPEFPVVVVRAFRPAAPTKASDGSLRLSVEYDVIGLVGEGPNRVTFRSEPTVRKDTFPVKCTGEGCRIDLDREVFHVSPHVGKDATLAWLKGLEGIRDTAQEKQAARRLYEQVQNAK
jgi:hypothetical protein